MVDSRFYAIPLGGRIWAFLASARAIEKPIATARFADRPCRRSVAMLPKETTPEEYDLVILGGGTGATIAAWTFARQGQRVAAIDRKYVGGSCPKHCVSP